MTLPDVPGPQQQGPQKPPARGGWLLALVAVPVLCCAAPGLLAAVGIGSAGALLAAGTGQLVVAVLLAALVGGLVALLVLRRRR